VVIKKTNKPNTSNIKISLNSKSRKISGNIFSKRKVISVKPGQKIQGKISLKNN
tara:strand:+ start:489 stop:650 length:162 start_codon:yes stop_codon:yes gene_type:complete